jgi:DNA-binding NarL/FixJ family response regulator
MSGPPEPLRVVVADDHPFYRRGLTRSLTASGVAVVAEAPSGAAAVQAVRETLPDVVVMDLNMPGVSGLEATRQVLDEAPGTRVLMLTVSADEADVADAIAAGACGYLLKDRPVQEVIAGVRAAAAGGSHFSAQLAMPLLRRLREGSSIAVDLTGVAFDANEREVLALMAEGRADHEIAAALDIGIDDVRAHAAAILSKLHRESRVKAALEASAGRRR